MVTIISVETFEPMRSSVKMFATKSLMHHAYIIIQSLKYYVIKHQSLESEKYKYDNND